MDVVLDEAGLSVHISGDAQLSIETALFRRAITNLLQNAIQHSSSGAEISVTIETQPAGTRIAVANPGAPIPDEPLGRLFERFYRADPSGGNYAANNGPRLAIVHARATMEGGWGFTARRGGNHPFCLTSNLQR